MTKYGMAWYKKVNSHLIREKYKIYGYTSLDKLAEWNRLLPKQSEEYFICKKEYQYINPFDVRKD